MALRRKRTTLSNFRETKNSLDIRYQSIGQLEKILEEVKKSDT